MNHTLTSVKDRISEAEISLTRLDWLIDELKAFDTLYGLPETDKRIEGIHRHLDSALDEARSLVNDMCKRYPIGKED